jgi:enoyl-CoA hydratase/carnithine racemase
MTDINFRIEDRVARITLARPPLNVLNITMMREIGAALTESAQREVVAIVFDADKNCRAFSAGVAIEEHVQETIFQMLDTFHAIFRRRRRGPRRRLRTGRGLRHCYCVGSIAFWSARNQAGRFSARGRRAAATRDR